MTTCGSFHFEMIVSLVAICGEGCDLHNTTFALSCDLAA